MCKKLSVIIVTYNSEELIFDCLDSIYKYNDIGNSLEIIIVDNCSEDRERVFTKIRSDYPSDIVFIESPVNKGYGHGNNQGVLAASAPRLVIMNPDVKLVEPIFRKLNDMLNANPNIGMIGVHFTDGSNHLYFKPEYNNLLRMLFSKFFIRLRLYSIEQMYFSGSFLVFDKQSFFEAGSFDENIFLFHEEADISNRILSIGKKTILSKDIFVLHLTHGREVKPYLYRIGAESRKYYFNKYNIDLNKFYNRSLIKYRIKQIITALKLHDNNNADTFEWIKMCKNKGKI